MKKSFLILAAIVSLNFSLSAQDERVANRYFYSEFGGPGVLMSVHFDSRFSSNSRFGIGYRVGLGFGSGQFEDRRPNYWGYYQYRTQTYFSIPVGLNYVFGRPNSAHTFEAGAGFTILTRKVSLYYNNNWGQSRDDTKGNLIGFFTFMYRRMPEDGGFSWRIGLTPIIGTAGDLFPSGAVGFGFVF